MNKRTLRLLELLFQQMKECTKCNLNVNGGAIPYISPDYYQGYFLIGEAPGKDEIRDNEPFVGKAGNILWTESARYGLEKRHCAIINTVNCRPVNEKGGNGKPTKEQQSQCFGWLRKFVKILDPDKILLLGGYPLNDILGVTGTRKYNAQVIKQQVFQDDKMRNYYCGTHPAACIYNDVDKENLRNSLRNFVEN